MFPTSVTFTLAELGNTRVRLGKGVRRDTAKQRHDEAEGGGGASIFGHDLMQGPAGKAALRQMAINGGKAEGEGFCFFGPKPFHPLQQAPQFFGHGGAVLFHHGEGKGHGQGFCAGAS